MRGSGKGAEMHRSLNSLFILFALAAFALDVRAQDIIPVSEIQAGMKGYGKTVFKGVEPERFELEVIDVLHNVMPQLDVILVRCWGHDLEKVRVVAGMSGSPVYLDDRLAGAIAFTWAYSQDPIAGVTPIESMLAEARSPSTIPLSASSGSSASGLVPIATPLAVSGANPGLLEELEKSLKPYHLVPVPGGSASGQMESPRLGPGSAIGAQLVSGDVDVTAVGTVSFLQGDTLIAFGHSFLNGGKLSVPLTSARIHTIVGSQYLSFKVASPIKTIGALEQDLLVGIFGRLGASAEMVPYELRVDHQALGASHKYHFDIISHHILTYPLLRALLFQVIAQAGPTSEPGTVKVKTEFQLEDYPPITYEDTYYTMSNSFSSQFLEPVQLLLMNPFEYARLKSVKMELEISPELKVATINSAWVKSQEVHAGEDIELHVLLRPFNQPEAEEVIFIPVPEYARGLIRLQIAGGGSVAPDVAPPQSVEDLIAALKKIFPTRSLVATYPVEGQSLDYNGMRLHKLPPSMAATLSPPSSNLARPTRELNYKVKEVPYIVLGKTRLNIRVLPPKSR
jgi:hypothetical protein